MNLSEDELETIYDLHLLTNKKFIYACNVSEEMMNSSEEELQKII
jgi:ribosome-binding ATPase YchF (GTP1/OBG family)